MSKEPCKYIEIGRELVIWNVTQRQFLIGKVQRILLLFIVDEYKINVGEFGLYIYIYIYIYHNVSVTKF